jgi:hypothetical protein
MADDWRVQQLETIQYLRGQSFVRKAYTAYRPDWDHDHCAVCWTKIAEPRVEADALHEGYAVTADYENGADYEWVCADCFEFGKAEMEWSDVTQTPR